MSCEILKTEVRVTISVSINVFSRLSTTKGMTAMKSWIRPDSTSVKAQLKCPLSSSIKMTTLISHSLY